MTRINCVPVETLTDQHLIAEYKEISRPFTKVAKRREKYGEANMLKGCTVPDKYKMGEGHETFFFNKLGWLKRRYEEVFAECVIRGFNIDFTKWREIHRSIQSLPDGVDWKPTPEEIYVNMARLCHSHFKETIEEYKQ